MISLKNCTECKKSIRPSKHESPSKYAKRKTCGASLCQKFSTSRAMKAKGNAGRLRKMFNRKAIDANVAVAAARELVRYVDGVPIYRLQRGIGYSE